MTDGFFDDSHVMGLEGSAGPPVGLWEMVQQGFRQQWHVDSQRALDEELRTRWAESLQGLRAAGQNFNAPVDPLMYRGYAQFVRDGTPVTTPTVEGEGYGARINYDLQRPHPEFEEIRRANEAIRQLNNPEIRSFEQILEEVSEMQRGVEEQTGSMYERGPTGSFFAELLGAAAGSFTIRDPLNVVTAPIGAGRTIAMKIGTDMAVAAGVVTATEFGDVAPNRALAGLPERSPLLSIGAAAFGAGVIRGALEGAGYGIRRLRGSPAEDIDFDLRDLQLQQMFEANANRPTARAGAQALDDMIFIERNNPYGEGRAAQERFMAELQEVQRVMDGEPMTAIARVLPPYPFEYIQKAADFEIVREQAPLVYTRMTEAQKRVDALNGLIEQRVALRDLGDALGPEWAAESVERTSDESFTETAELMSRYEAEALPNESRTDFVIRKTREELDSQFESIRARPGVNKGRLMKIVGPQLYENFREIGSVSIKEVLQNSFDAIKTALLRGLGKGKIDINTNALTREIEITDNGVGMAPETLATTFLEIAGTGKEEGARSGGFGLAKMLFLYGNDDLRVITMRDGRVSEMITTGDELSRAMEDPDVAPNIEVRDPTPEDLEMFPDGSGTRVVMKIPKTFIDPNTGDDLDIDFPRYDFDVPALGKSPLFADIDVKFNHLDVGIGSHFPVEKFMPFSNIDFGWGNARIYVTRESEKTWGNNLHVLSNGIFQFSKKLSKDPTNIYSDPIPHEFYIDIAPKASAGELGYPFTHNRQSFTKAANTDLNKVLNYINALYAFDDLAKGAESFGNARYFDEETGQLGGPINLQPTIKIVNKFANTIKPGDEMYVRDGRLYVNGRELPELKEADLKEGLPKAEELKVDPELIDPNKVMVHDNMLITNLNGEKVPFYDIMRLEFGEQLDDFLYGVGNTFRALRDRVVRILEYDDLGIEAVGVSFDPQYRGVSIRVPFSGSFINPFLPETTQLREAGYAIFGTMIHELAHHKVRSHNERFPAEMQRLWYKLQANADDFLELQNDLIAVLEKHEEVFIRGKELLEGSDAELAGNRLGGVDEGTRAEGGDERLFEGNDRGGEEGVGPGGVPAEAGRGAGPAQPRREFGSDDFGPEAEAGLRDQLRIANQEYQKAYRAVEAEATRMREEQARIEATQQQQAANIFAIGLEGRTFTGPLLRHDYVEGLVERINAFNDTLDETVVARFVRQMEGEGVVARETWRTEDGRIDIGLTEPVDPEFHFLNEDGTEVSIAAAMRDLQDEADLDDAMRICLP